ncbi:MAG: hypothetical protein NVS2B12_20690 [Ktedonobacteraceae bacterium]
MRKSKKQAKPITTIQIRLYPTPEQSHLLMAHCQEYIATINVLIASIDADILPENASSKDFVSPLPSIVKCQALQDAYSVFKRSLELGVIPILKKPICVWNNQNWHLTDTTLKIPVYRNGKAERIAIACDGWVYAGKAGTLRIKKKRNKWIADISLTLPDVTYTESEKVMGVDLGINVPAWLRCKVLRQWTLSTRKAPSVLRSSQIFTEGQEDTRYA